MKIRLTPGFQPEVRPVELRPSKRDKDRSEDEERAWQAQRVARALREAQDAAWAPFSRSMPHRTMALLTEVLRRAGALFDGSDRELTRGPAGEVDGRKLGSNDGWHVTAEESAFLSGRLKAWLEAGQQTFQFRGVELNLTPASTDRDDRATREFLLGMSAFFARAAEHQGFEVS